MKKFFLLVFLTVVSLLSFGNEKNSDLMIDDYTYIEENTVPEKITVVQALKVSETDPVFIKDVYSRRAVPFVYDTLFVMDKDKKIIPLLAEDYKWLNSRELYLKIKENIYFHDGSILTAYDVKNSLDRLRKEGALKIFYSPISEIKVLNSRELVIKLNEEDSTLVFNLSHEISSITKLSEGKIIGTGPFYIKEFDKNYLQLENFKKYFDVPSKVETVVFERGISPNQRMIALFNGDADIALDIDEAGLKTGKSYGIIDESTVVEKSSDINTLALVFGNNFNYSLKDRKAVESAVHREANSFFPKGVFIPIFSKINTAYNLSEARENIKNSNLSGRKINLMILNTYQDIQEAEKIKSSLEDAGLKVNILPTQIDSFYYKLENKDFDIALNHIVINKNYPAISFGKILLYDIEDEDIYNSLEPFWEEMKKEKNIEEKIKIFDKAVEFIYEKLPYIPIKHTASYIVGEDKYYYIKKY